MTKDNGGPAFPTVAGQTVYSNGMSLRDWFAGQALAGILANPTTRNTEPSIPDDMAIAQAAYIAAAAMLATRKEHPHAD